MATLAEITANHQLTLPKTLHRMAPERQSAAIIRQWRKLDRVSGKRDRLWFTYTNATNDRHLSADYTNRGADLIIGTMYAFRRFLADSPETNTVGRIARVAIGSTAETLGHGAIEVLPKGLGRFATNTPAGISSDAIRKVWEGPDTTAENIPAETFTLTTSHDHHNIEDPVVVATADGGRYRQAFNPTFLAWVAADAVTLTMRGERKPATVHDANGTQVGIVMPVMVSSVSAWPTMVAA